MSVAEKYGIVERGEGIVNIDGHLYKWMRRYNIETKHEWYQFYTYRDGHGFVFLSNVHKNIIAKIKQRAVLK